MHEKFGLHSPPFRLTPDPSMFFGSRGHVRAQSYLTFGLSQGEGFVVITGDVGAGKTTLISHLLGSLKEQKYRIARIVTSHLNAEDTLRMIVRSFGIVEIDGGKATLLRQLETFLSSAAAAEERCLLIVDEVQNMPFATLEELRMLSNIEIPGGASLQTFLVGQPEFRKIIGSSDLRQLRQRVVASCHLSPMEENEVRDYVHFRLGQAGWVGDPSFAEGVFSEIFRQTTGVPRRINLLCSRLLLLAALDDTHRIELEDVVAVAEELASEVVGGEDGQKPNTTIEAGHESRSSISDEVLGLVNALQDRVDLIEVRQKKQDCGFQKMLLSMSEYLKDAEAGR